MGNAGVNALAQPLVQPWHNREEGQKRREEKGERREKRREER